MILDLLKSVIARFSCINFPLAMMLAFISLKVRGETKLSEAQFETEQTYHYPAHQQEVFSIYSGYRLSYITNQEHHNCLKSTASLRCFHKICPINRSSWFKPSLATVLTDVTVCNGYMKSALETQQKMLRQRLKQKLYKFLSEHFDLL